MTRPKFTGLIFIFIFCHAGFCQGVGKSIAIGAEAITATDLGFQDPILGLFGTGRYTSKKHEFQWRGGLRNSLKRNIGGHSIFGSGEIRYRVSYRWALGGGVSLSRQYTPEYTKTSIRNFLSVGFDQRKSNYPVRVDIHYLFPEDELDAIGARVTVPLDCQRSPLGPFFEGTIHKLPLFNSHFPAWVFGFGGGWRW